MGLVMCALNTCTVHSFTHPPGFMSELLFIQEGLDEGLEEVAQHLDVILTCFSSFVCSRLRANWAKGVSGPELLCIPLH